MLLILCITQDLITYSCVYYKVLRCNVHWNMYAEFVFCLVLLSIVTCNNLSSLSGNVLLWVYCKFQKSLVLMDNVYEASVVHVHFTISSMLNAYRCP